MNKTRLISIVVAAIVAAIFGTGQFNQDASSPSGQLTENSQPGTQLGPNDIALAGLPKEGQEVVRLIHLGGPFRYGKDGTVFQNREKRLPAKKRGYYREYTVRTPGEKSRGARRIVAGGAPKQPDVMYYTKDHYRSFLRIQGPRP